jgi:heme/copper-type cytochrome/quinol oxidase subunit 1
VKKILIALAVVLVVCVAGLLVTAVDQLVGIASQFHPSAGQITFWILVSAIVGAALFILFEDAHGYDA